MPGDDASQRAGAEEETPRVRHSGGRGWFARTGAALSASVGAVAGVAPHVLHHVGPIAGAALIGGVGGSVLFGAIGFVLMIPMLLRIERRFGTWIAPSIALSIFAAVFTISTLWIGPALRDGGASVLPPMDHSSHHHP
jgi:hypothetical protein